MGEKINNVSAMLNNPKQRNIYLLGAGLAILTIVVGGIYATKTTKTVGGPAGAQVASIPQVQGVPGTSNSARYNEMVQQNNVEEAQKALDKDATFIPVPVNTKSFNAESPIDALDAQIKAQKEKEAKEQAERMAQEEQAKQPEPQPEPLPEPQLPVVQPQPIIQQPVIQPQPIVVAAPPKPAKKYGSDDDYMLLATLSGSWKIKESRHEFNYAGQTAMTNQNQSAVGGNQVTQMQDTVSASSTISTKGALIAKAGTIFNAVLETGINSDEPSPVLAKIVSGDLKGTRLIGKMTTSGEKVIVEFNTAAVPKYPSSLKFKAVAVDPASSRTGLATDVDRHYLLRYGVLLGAAFLGGYADALASQNTTTTISPFGGTTTTKGTLSNKQITQQAFGSVGKELANSTRSQVQNIKPTITVDPGTAIGILIIDDLYETGN